MRYLIRNKKISISVISTLTLLIALLTGTPVQAGSMASARSVAMGGALTALATGVDAARFNPANLGIIDFRSNGIEIVGIGVNISNNAFTLDDYNNYTGAYLTSSDKTDILNKIPNEGLSISADAEASAFSIALGQFALSVDAFGATEVNLNKDIIDLILNGNYYGDTIEFTGSYSEAVGYGSIGLSYAKPVYSMGTREVAVGATIKYIRGLGVEEIVEMEGLATTGLTGFSGNGRLIARTASGGSGYALDLGATLKLNKQYSVGVSIKNFISGINWNNQTEEHGYLFNFDTVTVDNIDGDFVVSDDYSIPIDGFKTTLPSVLTVGMGKRTGKLLWAVDWEQGFRRAPGASSKPKLSAGLEWKQIPVVPLRAGFSIGGNRGTSLSFGSGLDLSAYYLDFAVITGGSLSGGANKGANFAISTGIRF